MTQAYRVTDTAVTQARCLGIYGNTACRVARMARRAALITHRHGNRRFGRYILDVDEDMVFTVHKK